MSYDYSFLVLNTISMHNTSSNHLADGVRQLKTTQTAAPSRSLQADQNQTVVITDWKSVARPNESDWVGLGCRRQKRGSTLLCVSIGVGNN